MKMKSTLNTEATKAVESLIEAFIKSWNDKNLEEFGELFTSDAEFTDVVGQTAIGKEAIIKQHEFPFGSVLKFATFEMKDVFLRELSPEFVIVSALWKVEGSITPNQKPLPNRSGVIQMIIKRENNSYQIKLVHNSDHSLPYERQEKFIK